VLGQATEGRAGGEPRSARWRLGPIVAGRAVNSEMGEARLAPTDVRHSAIVDDVNGMIASGKAQDPCDALAQLLAQAKAAKDRARVRRIQTTQKAYGCRRSRLTSVISLPGQEPQVV
jgi:hypothetical protein